MEVKNATATVESENRVLTYGDLTFYYIESGGSWKIEQLETYDAIVLEANHVDFARFVLKSIRSSFDVNIYLKPVYLINYKETRDSLINELNDGIIGSFDQINEKIKDVQRIQKLAKHLDHTASNSFEIQVFKKTLNYLYTRENSTLKPIADAASYIGYSYPLLAVNFESYEESKVLDLLEWAFNEDLIWPDYYDRVYLCNSCKTGRLSYRETCTSCKSSNLKQEDLVHHFPCGYIGPISDFKNKIDGSLNCPKCSKNIRHIGVDYDKPSIINQCLNCNSISQDYVVRALCSNCGIDSDVQYLIPKEINVFKLTKKGRRAAVSGIISSAFEMGDEINGTVSFSTFLTMMHYEQQRMKAKPTLFSCYSIIYFENIFDLLKTLGVLKEKILLSDIAQIIRDNISPADYISYQNPSLICICLNDAQLTKTEALMQSVILKLKGLVFDNFNKFELSIKTRTRALNVTEKLETGVKQITKELVEEV